MRVIACYPRGSLCVNLPDAVYVGIDPTGARKPVTLAAVDASGQPLLVTEGELEDALAFASAQEHAYIAINGPPRPSLGLLSDKDLRRAPGVGPGRQLEMRLAEHQLRERGISVAPTSSHRNGSASWNQFGYLLHEGLEDLGYVSFPAETAPRQRLETHPHAVFCALLGKTPLPRYTLEGRIQRQLVLCEHGLDMRDPMDFFEEVTRRSVLKGELPFDLIYEPVALDALAAALTASLVARVPGSVLFLGAQEEGRIVLPVSELKPRY